MRLPASCACCIKYLSCVSSSISDIRVLHLVIQTWDSYILPPRSDSFFLCDHKSSDTKVDSLYLCFLNKKSRHRTKHPLHSEMGEKADAEHHTIIGDGFVDCMRIDPRRARFPCCIVWTPLPVVSWLIPFIGHIGICREDGVILDFAGPNFVSVDNFAFGAVARYVQINNVKECCVFSHPSIFNGEDRYGEDIHEREAVLTWDDALRKGTQEYQHRAYNLFTCNCHSFVANNLNRLGFRSGGWNVVNLGAFIFLKGKWVSKASIIKSFLPFVIIYSLGLMLGASTFLTFCALFAVLLIGWFLLGTYCFKNWIQL